MSNDINNTQQVMQAPPPPPLPAGFNVQQAPVNMGQTLLQAPPPPPLPAGFTLVGNGTNAVQKVPSMAVPTTATPTPAAPVAVAPVSVPTLAVEEANKPKVMANGGKLNVNAGCYGRSNADGLYYFAAIQSFDPESEKAVVKFFDDTEAELAYSKIYTIAEARKAMECFANHNEEGKYLPAVIDSITVEGKFAVHYKEDSSLQETLPLHAVRFAVY